MKEKSELKGSQSKQELHSNRLEVISDMKNSFLSPKARESSSGFSNNKTISLPKIQELKNAVNSFKFLESHEKKHLKYHSNNLTLCPEIIEEFQKYAPKL